jgi:class 3 adenylate cyclase
MSLRRRTATVLFLDVVDSTRVAAELGDARFRELLSRFNRIVREGLKSFGGREEDRAGDGFFATFPEPTRAIGCACSLAERVRELGIEIRSGIHTGETEEIEGKRQGIAVVIGARVMSLASAGEVLVTSTTKELATGSRYTFEDFSAHELKGVPGTWQVWAVSEVGGRPQPAPLDATEAAERLRRIEDAGPGLAVPRRAVVVGLGAAAVATAGVVFLRREPEPERAGPPDPGTLVEIGPESRGTRSAISLRPLPVRETIRHSPHAMLVGQGSVWLIRRDQLIQVDGIEGEEEGRAEIGRGNPVSINVASAFDAIWVMTDTELARIHPATRDVTPVTTVQRGISRTSDVVAGVGFVWVGMSDGELLRFDASRNEEKRRRGRSPIDAIGAGRGGVWTAEAFGILTQYDPDTLTRVGSPVELTGTVDLLVVTDDGVWALSRSDGTVTPVVGAEHRDSIRVGDEPTAIAAGLDAIWVGHEDGTIWRIDEQTRRVDDPIDVGTSIRSIAVDEEEDTLWVDIW